MKSAHRKLNKEIQMYFSDNGNSHKKSRYLFALILICVSLSALAVLPFFFFTVFTSDNGSWMFKMPATHDMALQVEQMKSFYQGLEGGNLYPRWEEDTNRGFGAPTTNFYPPGLYYLTSLLYAISRDWMVTLLIANLLMMIASGVSFFFYARQFISFGAATIGMGVYILLPYHLVDLYQRGALPELSSFIWMPLLLLFGERVLKQSAEENATERVFIKPSLLLNITGLAISYGAFLWSHPPTAYQFSLAFCLYILLLVLLSKNWKGLIFVGGAMVFGVLLSVAYLLPAFVEQDLIHHENLTDVFPYHSTYVFVHSIAVPTDGSFFRLINSIWLLNFLIIISSSVALFMFGRQAICSAHKKTLFVWLMIGCFASFMMSSPSEVFGRHIPKIEIGVFSWRMLAITALIAALLISVCVDVSLYKLSHKRFARVMLGSFCIVVITGVNIFSGGIVYKTLKYAQGFAPDAEHMNTVIIPRNAPANPTTLPYIERASFLGNKGKISIERWESEGRSMDVDLTEEDTLSIRTFNFPGWSATVDGKPETIATDSQWGNITLTLPSGIHEVELEYKDTPTRRIGEMVTLCSFFFLLAMNVLSTLRYKYKPGNDR
jgi:hypothetical protein